MEAHNSQVSAKIFQSTPSARRATHEVPQAALPIRISIHALREEGDLSDHPARYDLSISIHALREEGDHPPMKNQGEYIYFNPRPPRGGRPVSFVSRYPAIGISIHALREEGDQSGE